MKRSRSRLGLSRRSFLATSAGAAAAAGTGIGLPELAGASPIRQAIPFHGTHQSGIATPAQDALCFASYDLPTQSLQNVRDLFRMWSQAAAGMMAGGPGGGPNNREKTVPVDTGDALGLKPSHLTITFGFGPTLFENNGVDPFGLAGRKPAALKALPAFKGDQIDPSISAGDVCIQACSDDAQVAFHAVHTLTHMANGAAAIRWTQMGFGRTSSTGSSQVTPRNLMGFKDGTNNLRGDDATGMSQYVWVGSEGPGWMANGTYLVARKIRMQLGSWDGSILHEQEHTFGRFKSSGAPLTGHNEYDPVDLEAVDSHGNPIIPLDAHIRVAAPSNNSGRRLLRRGYSFSEGVDSNNGDLQAGLFFICFQRDPQTQFVAIQQQLANHDHLNRYIVHTASAVFAIPPGVSRSGYVGEGLLG